MFQRMAHRLAGDLDQSAERLVQFEEQEDRGAHGHRRRHERRNRGAVARREEAEAEEKDREPEHHYDQERLGNGRSCLLEKEPIHLAKLNGGLQGLGFRRTLRIGLRRQFLDGLIYCLPGGSDGRQFGLLGFVVRPDASNHLLHAHAQLRAGFGRIRAAIGQHTIEESELRRHLDELVPLRII